MHHSMLRVIGEHQLALIKLSNCRNNLYLATHVMSFPSVKQFRVYLMHYHEILRHCVTSLALEILSNSWL